MDNFSNITNYLTIDEFVSPGPVPPGTVRASDNHPLFTSEYLILQKLTGNAISIRSLLSVIKCIDQLGYLHRMPGELSPDEPDDHYGVIALLSVLGLKNRVRLPWKCCHLALIYMRAMQRGGLENAVGRLLSPIVATIIALSNWTPKSDVGNSMLTWCLIQGTKNHSLLCRLGAAVWRRRMVKAYGPQGSKGAAAAYFNPSGANHPLVENWVEV